MHWQDTDKVRDNFTLNYGIRYEYPSAIYQRRRDATNFIPGVGPGLLDSNLLLSIDPTKVGLASLSQAPGPFKLSNTGVHTDRNNFAPGVGFAYTPRFAQTLFANDSTVIRA